MSSSASSLDLNDPAVREELRKAIQLAAAAECWRAGDLDYKRDTTQKIIHEKVKASKHDVHFLLCSRRLGKTFELLLEAFECALSKPDARVLYLMPHAKDASSVVSDVLSFILSDCPKDVFDLETDYKKQEKEICFQNGSIIRLKGTNSENAQFLRGGHADLVVLDESALMDDLRHVYLDVVLPMTMTCNGRVIFATTPARSPGHESTAIYNDLADKGAVNTFTLRDNTRVEDWKKVKYLIAAGETEEHAWDILTKGVEPKTTTAKREYFCQFVTDSDSAVFPSFDEEARAIIVKDHPRPKFFDAYVGADPGFNDKTGILYGYFDFPNQVLVIEDESLMTKAGTLAIAKEIQQKEEKLWGEKKPLIRVSDIDLRLIADLWQDHGLSFNKAQGKDRESDVAYVNHMISMRQIVILPNCTGLIRQLQNAVYDASGKDFDRDPVDSHYDLAAALKYLCRVIVKARNPFPEWARRQSSKLFISPKSIKPLSGGLLGETPTGRKLIKSAKRKRNEF